MNITLNRQKSPNERELTLFFENAFDETDSSAEFSEDQQQKLDEWFSVPEMIAYLPHGVLIEARNEQQTLVGALFIGKQNPIFWNDGHKVEIVILAVSREYRHQGLAQRLMGEAEKAAQQLGGHKLIVNTHSAMATVHDFYLKQGFTKMGVLENYYENGSAVFFQKAVLLQ